MPLTDEHRNEYVPGSAQRLAWLTGFTGSAGMLILLAERAAVFVDGRYTVQAEAQLDPQLFERRHLIEEPPAKWLGDHLSAGARIGYDPTLHVKAEVERYQAACAKADAELVALEPTIRSMPSGPAARRRRSRRSGSWTSATRASRRMPSARAWARRSPRRAPRSR